MYLVSRGKKLIAMAMKNNMSEENIQVLGCKVLNNLAAGGM